MNFGASDRAGESANATVVMLGTRSTTQLRLRQIRARNRILRLLRSAGRRSFARLWDGHLFFNIFCAAVSKQIVTKEDI